MLGRQSIPASLDDERRVARLKEYGVMDTPRELVFDRFVFTVAQLFRVPIALIGLADHSRHWYKAKVGLSWDEVPRTTSLCESLLASGDSLVMEDLSLVPQFASHPFVAGPPLLRFFAAVPLVAADGLRLGSLCVADRAGKLLLARQIVQLQDIALSVVRALEARRLPEA